MREQESADYGDAERAAGFTADSSAEGDGNGAEEGGHGGHHDRAETLEASLVDGFGGSGSGGAFGVEGEVDDHDGVLFHDADEQDDAEEGIEVEVLPAKKQGEERSDGGGGQAGKNGDGVDEALIEHAEDEIDDHDGDDEQKAEAFERALELRGCSLKGK